MVVVGLLAGLTIGAVARSTLKQEETIIRCACQFTASTWILEPGYDCRPGVEAESGTPLSCIPCDGTVMTNCCDFGGTKHVFGPRCNQGAEGYGCRSIRG